MPVFCVDGLRSGTWRTLVALVLLASGVVIAHLMLCSATGAGAGSGGADGLPAEWVQKVEVALEDAHSMCVTLRGVEFVHCFRNVLYKLHTVGDGWTSPILYYYVDGVCLRTHYFSLLIKLLLYMSRELCTRMRMIRLLSTQKSF